MRLAGTIQGAAVVLVVATGCAGDRPADKGAVATQSRSLVSTPAARRNIATLRARFGIGASLAIGFRSSGAGSVRTVLPAGAKRVGLKSASVVLPARANGAVRIQDDTSHLGVSFALRGAGAVPLAVANGIALYARALGGADVLQRPSVEGTEDYVAFERAPAEEQLVYDVNVCA